MREKYKGNARDAHLHMPPMFVTCPTFHCDRSPLNELAPATVAEVGRGWGGENGTMREKYNGNARDAHLHMACMVVTCPTFHCDRSPLNEVAPLTEAEVGRG